MRPSTLPAVLLCCSLVLAPTLHAQSTPDYKSNPKFTAAMAEAKQLERQRQTLFAIEAYKKAIAGPSGPPLPEFKHAD